MNLDPSEFLVSWDAPELFVNVNKRRKSDGNDLQGRPAPGSIPNYVKGTHRSPIETIVVKHEADDNHDGGSLMSPFATAAPVRTQISIAPIPVLELPVGASSLATRLYKLPVRHHVVLRAGRSLREHRSSVEANIAQHVGKIADHPCKHCEMGYGPFTECITVDEEMRGSCANCYTSHPERCTFRLDRTDEYKSPKSVEMRASGSLNSSTYEAAPYTQTIHDKSKSGVSPNESQNPGASTLPDGTNHNKPLAQPNSYKRSADQEIHTALRIYRKLTSGEKARLRADMNTIDAFEALEVDDEDGL